MGAAYVPPRHSQFCTIQWTRRPYDQLPTEYLGSKKLRIALQTGTLNGEELQIAGLREPTYNHDCHPADSNQHQPHFHHNPSTTPKCTSSPPRPSSPSSSPSPLHPSLSPPPHPTSPTSPISPPPPSPLSRNPSTKTSSKTDKSQPAAA